MKKVLVPERVECSSCGVKSEKGCLGHEGKALFRCFFAPHRQHGHLEGSRAESPFSFSAFEPQFSVVKSAKFPFLCYHKLPCRLRTAGEPPPAIHAGFFLPPGRKNPASFSRTIELQVSRMKAELLLATHSLVQIQYGFTGTELLVKRSWSIRLN